MLHNTNRKPSNQPKYNEVTALEILRHIDIAAVLKNPILFVILIHLVSLYTVRSSSATSTNIIEEPQSPSWLNTYSLKAGLGYNDNITFSSVERDNSPFIIGGVDAMFYRIPKDDYSFYAFILGEGKYYTDAESVEMEKFIISQAELEKEFSDKYRLGTRIGHIYQDRIFDASITEDIYSTLQVQGHDFSVSPFIEYDFTSRLTGGFKLQLERQLFDEPLDDYWEYRPAFSLEFSRSKHSGLEFTYKPGYRTYDTRFSRDAAGSAEPGNSLVYQRHELELDWSMRLDRRGKWSYSLAPSLLLNRDNGGGYFDFNRYQLSQDIKYSSTTWNTKLRLKYNYYDYLVQTASDNAASHRYRHSVSINLRGEKDLSKRFVLFAEFEHEQSISNTFYDQFQANILTSGIRWEF